MAIRKTKGKKKPASRAPGQPRMLKKPQYKSFRLHRKIRPYQPVLPKARQLFARSLKGLKARWRVFVWIAIIYLLLNLVLVKGFASTVDLKGTKDILDQLYVGAGGKTLTAVALFGSLVNIAGSGSGAAASVYQSVVVVICMLAVVWAVRQQHNKVKIRARDAFYQGMYPLIPFVLILMVIGLQLLPLGIGGWLYSATINGGIAVTALEKTLWIIFVMLLCALSFYMITSSMFALFVVTLPNMTPMRALRSARQLTLHRRWTVVRKVLFLVAVMVLLAIVIMLPFILWLPQIAEWVFFALSAFGLLIPVAYLYELYRELLNE